MIDDEMKRLYAQALTRVEVAHGLIRDLQKVCPDAQFDPVNATANAAARAALHSAIEMITLNEPRDGEAEFLRAHWAGLMEAAQRIISAVQFEMYDPRSHPERYQTS